MRHYRIELGQGRPLGAGGKIALLLLAVTVLALAFFFTVIGAGIALVSGLAIFVWRKFFPRNAQTSRGNTVILEGEFQVVRDAGAADMLPGETKLPPC